MISACRKSIVNSSYRKQVFTQRVLALRSLAVLLGFAVLIAYLQESEKPEGKTPVACSFPKGGMSVSNKMTRRLDSAVDECCGTGRAAVLSLEHSQQSQALPSPAVRIPGGISSAGIRLDHRLGHALICAVLSKVATYWLWSCGWKGPWKERNVSLLCHWSESSASHTEGKPPLREIPPVGQL